MDSEIKKIHNSLVSGELRCEELVQDKIKLLKQNENQSVIHVFEEEALEKARAVDQKIKSGVSIGLLEGIPFGVKDTLMLVGAATTSASSMLENYQSSYTATAIQKLIDAGAIPLVKENCDAFGHGSTSENSIFGAVKNAGNSDIVAGGSSGGSAVNVAADATVFSIGGDTGGSIRQPAGYNKVYGLKPTYGKVSRYGLHAYGSSTDCVGPLAKSVEDIRLVLNCISGKDIKDQTTVDTEVVAEKDIEIKQIKKVGYYTNFIENNAISTTTKEDFKKFLNELEAKGVELVPLDFFDADTLVSTYYVLAMAETASNLSRLDGTNYGKREEQVQLKETYATTRSMHFSEESKRRIVGGNQVLSEGYGEQVYLKALALRNLIENHFEADFNKIDVLVSPVTPSNPPKIGGVKDPMEMYLSDAYTVGFSLGQLPVLTCPQGTETGIQITGAKFKEAQVLQFANFIKSLN